VNAEMEQARFKGDADQALFCWGGLPCGWMGCLGAAREVQFELASFSMDSRSHLGSRAFPS
jgi:hypothetical protein